MASQDSQFDDSAMLGTEARKAESNDTIAQLKRALINEKVCMSRVGFTRCALFGIVQHGDRKNV